MIDFFMISTRSTKRGTIEVYPKFLVKKSSDLMIRGSKFYAVWVEDRGLWSTDEYDVMQLIDRELDLYADEYRKKTNSEVKVLHLWDAETGMVDAWNRYCQKQMRDSFIALNEHLVFSNTETNKKDYASKKLSYPLESGDINAYEKIISTLYSEEERHKIEWAIGSIISGDSKKLQKFMVLYGAPGSGKGTILNIIQSLFDGYYSVFDAKALGSSNASFALESFRENPLVSIQHDGDLSRIEDNTRLNSLVSHELMEVNEKFKSSYKNSFKSFLFMGTNKPVKITDAKSGLIRRLIDVTPSGDTIPSRDYNKLTKQVNFELGAIAYHCQEVYLKNPEAYDNYIPVAMLGASNDFYNFVLDAYLVFKSEDCTTMKAAWEMYKNYCEDAKVPYPYAQRAFKEELKNYFKEYKERYTLEDGTRARSYYSGFCWERFERQEEQEIIVEAEPEKHSWLDLKDGISSIFDQVCSGCFAQYASDNDTPLKAWADVKTKLKSLDTSKTHYARVPIEHIVIDFDIKDENGEKSYEKNIEAAATWPPTYAEVSKGGAGIHLHYLYTGDPNLLSRVYDDHIEIKVFVGNSSLRRRLSKCNDLPIATISSGLPLKGESKTVNFDSIKSEKGLRTMIKRNLNKESHPGTKPSVDFIYKILDDAYKSDLKYDVTDMRNAILTFAANSSNQAEYCIKMVNKMQFKSDEPSTSVPVNVLNVMDKDLVFYDVEVFPNLFLVNYKIQGPGKTVIRLINPKPIDIENMTRFKLVGFNCRRYDNHIMYARMMGYTNEQLYNLSQRIINGSANCFFGEAYNMSYTDVYDFSSAGNKKSLKKWEIELGLKHHELGLPWDKPVPEELWSMVAEYCDDDVIATEEVFNHLSADWTARQILADLAGLSYNDTTNTLTTRIIFGKEKKPQSKFNYRDLSKPVKNLDPETIEFLKESKPKMMAQLHGPEKSLLPYFPGYTFEMGKSLYRGVDPKEGGFAEGDPGMVGDVALLDIASMHPNSAIAEVLFGVEFTRRFKEIVDGRVSIKHEAWAIVNTMLDGKLTPYIQKVLDGEMTSGDLANALKTAINSVYGLTSARFDNAFRDPRNLDNIVAKRGALFMIDLKMAVLEKGFKVAHIKTDSIKIPDATPEIIQFVMDFGERYGYTFEHEATYDRMCLVNDAVYIAKYATPEKCMELYGYSPKDNYKHGGEWTATGTQFAVPYVFKKLFSKESITFEDMCETKSVTSALYLDMNENLPDGTIYETIKNVREQLASEKEDKVSKRDLATAQSYDHISNDKLDELLAESHDYHFVGKVGQFCPIKPGCGGGELVREKDGKYYSATGAKGYRWMESAMVNELNKIDEIDRSYYDALVNEAAETIIAYGNFEWFVSDDPYVGPHFSGGVPDYDDEIPFD